MREKRRFVSVLFVIISLLAFTTSAVALQNTLASDYIKLRPYIDRIVYRYWPNAEYEIRALLDNEFDLVLDDETFLRYMLDNPDEMILLDQDPDIDLHKTTGNGYWCIDFDYGDNYPMNISGFRRAFAYAFDKTRVITEYPAGLFSVHDSVVPNTSSFCIETELDWNYYSDQSEIGNQILDDLGFAINSTTGWRDAPNGDPFRIDIGPLDTSTYIPNNMDYPPIFFSIAYAAKDALNELHVNAECEFMWFVPECCEMVIHDTYFCDNNIDWLGDDQTFTSFSNSTFELYLDDLLYGTSYDAVYDAGAEIQRILHYNVPRLVVCTGLRIQPYRTDRFEGHVDDVIRGISGIWSLCNIHNKTGSTAGGVRIGFQQDVDDLNIYTTDFSDARPFLENLWPTLFTVGPNLELIPNLATSITSETHADNAAVPDGHTRITVDLLQNATWSDGVPLTAEDVVFTVTYEYESGRYGNPAVFEMENLVAAYAPTSTKAVFEYNTESYWHQFNRATRYIIPKHIFNDIDGVGFENWNAWDPVFPSNLDEVDVTCGPFVIDDYSTTWEWRQILFKLDMKTNPDYYYAARSLPENDTSTQSPTTPGTPYQWNRFLFGFYASTLVWVSVMLIFIIWKERIPRNL
ncbi:MAG: ABC transporter substrate-binding protein [Candidatus Thorarchaeota archaeon]